MSCVVVLWSAKVLKGHLKSVQKLKVNISQTKGIVWFASVRVWTREKESRPGVGTFDPCDLLKTLSVPKVWSVMIIAGHNSHVSLKFYILGTFYPAPAHCCSLCSRQGPGPEVWPDRPLGLTPRTSLCLFAPSPHPQWRPAWRPPASPVLSWGPLWCPRPVANYHRPRCGGDIWKTRNKTWKQEKCQN